MSPPTKAGGGATRCDVVLAGVGGQGVLSIAWVIGHAAVEAGLHLKQPEVHGMAQRGGAVSAHVRLASAPIASDLIAEGSAAMMIAVEPLESLRHAKLLRADGWIVTDITPLENVANYPAHDALYDVLFGAPHVLALDATRLATRAGTVKAQNMVVLGAAASRLPVPEALLEKHVRALFAAKGNRIADANVAAFGMGVAASRFHAALIAAGVSPAAASRVTAVLDFAPSPVSAEAVAAWAAELCGEEGNSRAVRLFAARGATHRDAEDSRAAATCQFS
jgi:indolepyruvate ferredoxin oxidoreductase beta subunit